LLLPLPLRGISFFWSSNFFSLLSVSAKRALLLSFACPISFFYVLVALKESNKEKAPEMTNLARPYARYTKPPAIGQSKFRTISGLLAHPHLHCFVNN
jgi:hypothetical protein